MYILIINIITNMVTWLRVFQIIVIVLSNEKIFFIEKFIDKSFHLYHLHYTRYFFLNHRHRYRFYTIIFLHLPGPIHICFPEHSRLALTAPVYLPAALYISGVLWVKIVTTGQPAAPAI